MVNHELYHHHHHRYHPQELVLKPVTSNVVDEIESMPQLNGIYVREYFEELYKEFKKFIIFNFL